MGSPCTRHSPRLRYRCTFCSPWMTAREQSSHVSNAYSGTLPLAQTHQRQPFPPFFGNVSMDCFANEVLAVNEERAA